MGGRSQGRLATSDRRLYQGTVRHIAGVDEAGRGPLAGPVVAAAVILPRGFDLPDLDDSKRLSPAVRENLFAQIAEQAIAWAVAIRNASMIDRLNILQATLLAMQEAVEKLRPAPDLVLVDGNRPIPNLGISQRLVVHGDATSANIAAASIVAKVTRDRIMRELDARFPMYGFAAHKGYPTRRHIEALEKHGPCPEHRFSFAPVLRASQMASANCIPPDRTQTHSGLPDGPHTSDH